MSNAISLKMSAIPNDFSESLCIVQLVKPAVSCNRSLIWQCSSSCVTALRWVWAHYPAAGWILLHTDQTRGWSKSLKNGAVPLLGQGGVWKQLRTWIFPPTYFTVGLNHCDVILSPGRLLTFTLPSVTTLIHRWDSSSLWDSGIS